MDNSKKGFKAKREFKEAIDKLKSKGVFTTSPFGYATILRYDFENDILKVMDNNALMRLFDKLYLNSYGVDYGLSDIIQSLPVISTSQFDNYKKYQDAITSKINIEDLENELKPYIETNNNNKKDVKNLVYPNLKNEIQILINQDVFTDGKKLYQFKNNNFDLVTKNNILKVMGLSNDIKFSINVLWNNTLIYRKHLINLNDLIKRFRVYNKNQRILKETKADYDAIFNIIASFD